MTRLSPGAAAPAFALPDLDGREVAFDPAGPGHKGLVFYKSDCEGCQFSMPLFARLHSRIQSPHTVYAVAQDTYEVARDFARARGLAMPHLVDLAPFPVSRAYGLLNVPTLFVIDARGQIVIASPAFQRDQVERAAVLLASDGPAKPPALFDETENVPQLKPG